MGILTKIEKHLTRDRRVGEAQRTTQYLISKEELLDALGFGGDTITYIEYDYREKQLILRVKE